MSVVQYSSSAGLFALVGLHNVGFEPTGAKNDVLQYVAIALSELRSVTLEIRKQFRIEDHAVFDDLGQAGPIVAIRQRCQDRGIDQNTQRLPEGANHIFGARQIDAYFSAHRAVDLRQ